MIIMLSVTVQVYDDNARCDNSVSHSGEFQDLALLGCDPTHFGRSLPTFQKKLLLPFPA
jgi:hypothetical protein